MKDEVILIGGGRWARVLLTIVRGLLSSDKRIIWVTTHGSEENRLWISENEIQGVRVTQSLDTSELSVARFAIVANASSLHGETTNSLLQNGLHVLSEKPAAYTCDRLERNIQISRERNLLFAVNLEFMYAEYIQRFSQEIDFERANHIVVRWEDPFCEVRHGEVKHADVYTPVLHDQLPHCLSILSVLFPEDEPEVANVSIAPDSTFRVQLKIGRLTGVIILNRYGVKRVRKIQINEGDDELDFSSEPGEFKKAGRVVEKYSWKGDRPTTRSLKAFFEAAESGEHNLCNSAERTLGITGICESAHEKLLKNLRYELSLLKEEGKLDPENFHHQAMLVEIFVPRVFNASGERLSVFTDAEKLGFAQDTIKDRLDLFLKPNR